LPKVISRPRFSKPRASANRRLLEAEGYALALQRIHEVARSVDSNTMSLQYLEALRALGASPATKMVIPTEFTNLLRPFLNHTRDGAEPGSNLQ
jgi:hypothetical protein